MYGVRLAISAGTITLAVTAGLTAAGDTTARADECGKLLRCATDGVGDTVDSARKGDLKGTTDGVDKTAGDTVDGVRKTSRGVTGGGSAGSDGSGGSSGSSGSSGSVDGGAESAGSGASSSTTTGGKKREKTGVSRQGTAGAAGAEDTSLAVHLQQWAWPQRSLAAFSSYPSTARFADRPVKRPEVAPPVDTSDQEEPTDLSAARPAADASAPGRQEPPPATVFLASALAGSVGVSVLSVYWRRRQTDS